MYIIKSAWFTRWFPFCSYKKGLALIILHYILVLTTLVENHTRFRYLSENREAVIQFSQKPMASGASLNYLPCIGSILPFVSVYFVCPQVFHLRDIRWERPRFLSKSFLAFVAFNVISYSLLAAEVLTTNVADTSPDKKVQICSFVPFFRWFSSHVEICDNFTVSSYGRKSLTTVKFTFICHLHNNDVVHSFTYYHIINFTS